MNEKLLQMGDLLVSDEQPFVIWTWRRTGGTNLARCLFSRSRYDRPDLPEQHQHEPFILNRPFGPVTEVWRSSNDYSKLKESMREVLTEGALVKHCVDNVHPEVSRALAEVSTELGYRHIFLVRRDPVDRLLSLYFAQRFDIWGKEHLGRVEPKDLEVALQHEEVPIEQLAMQEAEDRKRLIAVFDHLVELGELPAIAVFEDLYNRTDSLVSMALLRRLAAYVQIGDIDDQTAEEVLFEGGQKTRSLYKQFGNYKEFRDRMADQGSFQLSPPVPFEVSKLHDDPGAIVRFFNLRLSWRADLLAAEGVGLAGARADEAPEFRFVVDGQPIDAFSALPSPNFARANGNSSAAAHARFRVIDIPRGFRSAVLQSRRPGDDPVDLATISLKVTAVASQEAAGHAVPGSAS